MGLTKVSSSISLLVLALVVSSAQVNAVDLLRPLQKGPPIPYTPSGVRPGPLASPQIIPDNGPPHPATGDTHLPGAAIITPAPTMAIEHFGPLFQPLGPARTRITRTDGGPRPPPMPRPPIVPNKRGEGEAPTEVFDRIADPVAPLQLGTPPPRSSPPRPHLKESDENDFKAGFIDRFATRSAPMARSAGAGGGISADPYPPNRRGVADSVIFFFLAAVGFFLLSMIWNLHFQFGTVREKARAIDASALAAMRMENMSREPERTETDKKSLGPGSWLRAANAPPASSSPV